MLDPLITLSQHDVQSLKALAAQSARILSAAANRDYEQDHLPSAPDTYVVQAPVGGIPGGSGAIPGTTTCDVYQLVAGSLVRAAPSVLVSNFGAPAVGGAWVLATLDRFGKWWANTAPQDTGDSVELWVANFVSGTTTDVEDRDGITTSIRNSAGDFTTTFSVAFAPTVHSFAFTPAYNVVGDTMYELSRTATTLTSRTASGNDPVGEWGVIVVGRLDPSYIDGQNPDGPTVESDTSDLAQDAATLTITGGPFDTSSPSTTNLVYLTGGATATVTAATVSTLTIAVGNLQLGLLRGSVVTDGQPNGLMVPVATVVPTAAVADTYPAQSQDTGVTSLTILGTGFGAGITVVFNLGAVGTVTAATPTQLTVALTTPPSTGELWAGVTSNGGLAGTTKPITGATTATPIVVTSNGHGLSNGQVVQVVGVLGNTGADGVWVVAGASTNTFQLAGSVGSGSYTVNTGTWQLMVPVAEETHPAVTSSSANVSIAATTITLNGTGFSVVPANNIVTFTTLGAFAGGGTVLVTSGNGVSPITVATAAPHGLTTGNTISIANVLGNTNANGTWTVTVVNTTTFTVAATGNGPYDGGGNWSSVTSSTPTSLTVTYATPPSTTGTLQAYDSTNGVTTSTVMVGTVVPAGVTWTMLGAGSINGNTVPSTFTTTASNTGVAVWGGSSSSEARGAFAYVDLGTSNNTMTATFVWNDTESLAASGGAGVAVRVSHSAGQCVQGFIDDTGMNKELHIQELTTNFNTAVQDSASASLTLTNGNTYTLTLTDNGTTVILSMTDDVGLKSVTLTTSAHTANTEVAFGWFIANVGTFTFSSLVITGVTT